MAGAKFNVKDMTEGINNTASGNGFYPNKGKSIFCRLGSVIRSLGQWIGENILFGVGERLKGNGRV